MLRLCNVPVGVAGSSGCSAGDRLQVAVTRLLTSVNWGRRRVKNLQFPVPGQQSPSQTGEMLTRLSRFGPAFPRLLANPPARFVSQSKPSGAAGSAAVTELHPAAAPAGHGEVSQYVKVSPQYCVYVSIRSTVCMYTLKFSDTSAKPSTLKIIPIPT